MFEPRARIMMVIQRLGGRAGGAERLFCDTANMFADAGYEVSIVYCDPTGETPLYRISPKVTRVNLWAKTPRGAPWYKLLDGAAKVAPVAPVTWLAQNLYFVRRLHAVARDARPNVIISFLPPANTPSLLAGWLAGVKVIPTNHNVPVHDYRSKKRWDQNPVDKILRFYSLHAASRIHVLVPSFAEWFPPRLRKKIVAIPNPVSPEFMVPEAPRARRKEILGVGRLTDVKNYGALIDAWALLAGKYPDWKVKIYGPGPQRRQLNHRIHELGLVGAVQLMGQESRMKPRYLEAEILAHPALFEGFGLSVAEALACGLPVVAFSDCEGVKEFVKDGVNGVMVDRAGGARALADGLERLIVDEGLRERLRRQAPESIRPYSVEAFRDRWTRLLDEVLSA